MVEPVGRGTEGARREGAAPIPEDDPTGTVGFVLSSSEGGSDVDSVLVEVVPLAIGAEVRGGSPVASAGARDAPCAALAAAGPEGSTGATTSRQVSTSSNARHAHATTSTARPPADAGGEASFVVFTATGGAGGETGALASFPVGER